MQIIIDGVHYEAQRGETVLQVCQRNGIHIPTLCHDKRLNPTGSCRLCLVEIKGKLDTSCTVQVRDGMEVSTRNEHVVKGRRQVLDLLFSNHPNDCLTCKKSGSCDLQDYCYEYDLKEGSFRSGAQKHFEMDTSNKFYDYDADKCILCGKCVRVCQELQCTNAIGLKDRGFVTKVAAAGGGLLADSPCVSCGNCVAVCPTGALMEKSGGYRRWDLKRTRTTCSFCGVGCQIDLLTKGDQVVGVEPAFDTVPNDGLLCVKGRFAYHFINHRDRLTTPLVRREGKLEPASWDEALNLIAQKIRQVRTESGPDAIAGFSSARATNEDNYLFQKLLRAVIGTNNVDHCARL